MRTRTRREYISGITVGAVIVCIGIGGIVFLKHRATVLDAEHRIRKTAVYDAESKKRKIENQKDMYSLKLRQAMLDAGKIPSDYVRYTMPAQLYGESCAEATAQVRRAEAALDAFYLAHPKYRDRL